jgi:D-threo-aldose 1-dehydrogenase
MMKRVRELEKVCGEFDVPLPAAALQFVVAHPAIPTVISGTSTAAQLEQNLAWFSHPIPKSFWGALKERGLLREDAPTP